MMIEANTDKSATHKIDGIDVVVRLRSRTPWVLTVSLSGYLDIKNTGVFTRTIEQTFSEHSDITHVVFDLGRLTYISSTGIGAFAQILISAKNFNIEMTLYRPHDNVRLAFEALGFASFFSIVDDEKTLKAGISPTAGVFR